MLEKGVSFSEVSDWLNEQQIPTGKYCRLSRWTPQMVSRVTHNPLLKGLRVRNRLTVRRINKTGRRRSVKAPAEDQLSRECPHLAFIEPERYDRVIRMLDDRNSKYRRGRQQAKDARQGVPGKRTLWPGQSITCGICNRIYYYGAHGQSGSLVCSGAIHYRCWNAASIDGADASSRICAAAWEHVRQLPEFDQSLLADVRSELALLAGANSKQEGQLRRRLAGIESECANLITFIKLGRAQDSTAAELDRLEEEKRSIQLQLDELTKMPLGEPVTSTLATDSSRCRVRHKGISRCPSTT